VAEEDGADSALTLQSADGAVDRGAEDGVGRLSRAHVVEEQTPSALPPSTLSLISLKTARIAPPRRNASAVGRFAATFPARATTAAPPVLRRGRVPVRDGTIARDDRTIQRLECLPPETTR
jgi:hypothetical protein